MSRGLDAGTLTEVAKASVGFAILFAELDFASGFVRVHTSMGSITWGGYEWTGIGILGNVSRVEESAELSKRTITYGLRGVPNDIISITLNEHYQGRTAKLYMGFLSPNSGQLVATPYLLDQGRMDVSDVEEGDTCSVSITAESRVAAWDRPLIRRYTDAEQKSRFAGDKGLEFIDQAANKEIVWGRKA